MSGAKARLSKVAGHLYPAAGSTDVTGSSPSNRQTHVHHLPLSPTQFLPRASVIEPDAPAINHITADGKVLRRTYQEFADRARGLAYHLLKSGRRRVGILCPNTPAFLESIFAIPAAGGVSVAVNYRLRPEDIQYILQHADADAVIVDAEFLHLLDSFRRHNPDVPLLVDTDAGATDGVHDGPFDDAVREGLRYDAETGHRGWDGLNGWAEDEEDLIALAYTSGTTARPKGVQCTHRGAYLATLANVIESGLNAPVGGCRYLWTLPMFHATGWTFPWAVTAVRGTHYSIRKIDYPLIWKILREERVTHYCAAPTVNTLLCHAGEAERLPSPVRVTVAASPPTPSLFELMTSLNLHPVHVYGMTETYGPISKCYYLNRWDRLPDSERFRKLARQGHGFITSAPVRVIKPSGSSDTVVNVAKDGKEVGEVVFLGNICTSGYYKDEETTRRLFAGGVLHSGDLAVWHADGAVQIVDRAKDIIISGGENISSVALESILATHPEILEAGVIAVEDSRWGECPKAFITIKKGTLLTGEDVIRWARSGNEMSKFMVPREVEVVDELPKTSTGKIRKNILREWAKGGDHA